MDGDLFSLDVIPQGDVESHLVIDHLHLPGGIGQPGGQLRHFLQVGLPFCQQAQAAQAGLPASQQVKLQRGGQRGGVFQGQVVVAEGGFIGIGQTRPLGRDFITVNGLKGAVV